MGIPFTKYTLPSGRKSETTIERPAEIEAIASKFIGAGGRYECEVLSTGEVSLTAVFDDDDVEIEVCDNGPAVRDCVDALVLRSVSHVSS